MKPITYICPSGLKYTKEKNSNELFKNKKDRGIMKLDVKDLRIENLVNYEETTHIVVGIDQWHVYSYWQKDKEKEMLYKTPINQIKPIPLTEEWLLKFGFKKKVGNRFESDLLSQDIYFGNGYYIANVLPELKHVHQLQNLYFVLTGEELQIK
jgi:hypothetical protein